MRSLVILAAPLQGDVVFEDSIQGQRAKPLAPGYLLPRLRCWLSRLGRRSSGIVVERHAYGLW